MIYYSEDGVESFTLRESCDQVHCDVSERCGVLWDRYAVEGRFLARCEVFVLLACCASFDVVRYPFACSWPVVMFIDPACCFVSAWMSSCCSFVPYVHDSSMDVVDWWDC